MLEPPKIDNHVLLTFDYELFLGKRSGTAENCILKPTDKILEILESFKFRHAIFFVDTAYLLSLRGNPDSRCQEDYSKIVKQIKRIKDSGHYVYPHIHSHWLDAEYLPDLNQWCLSNSSKYRFATLSPSEQESLFSRSVQLIEEIVGHQDILGYRAGGWCIQPFETFRPFFVKYNVKYDFSILRGYRSDSANVIFNFTDVPDKIIYRFNDDVCIENTNGQFIEIPISQIKLGKFHKLRNDLWVKLLYKMGMKNSGDGLSHAFTSLRNTENGQMVSIELLTQVNLNPILNELKDTGFIHFMSHPKMLNAQSVYCLKQFLKRTAHLNINTDFKNIKI